MVWLLICLPRFCWFKCSSCLIRIVRPQFTQLQMGTCSVQQMHATFLSVYFRVRSWGTLITPAELQISGMKTLMKKKNHIFLKLTLTLGFLFNIQSSFQPGFVIIHSYKYDVSGVRVHLDTKEKHVRIGNTVPFMNVHKDQSVSI